MEGARENDEGLVGAGEEWRNRGAVRVSIETRGDAMSGADPELHLAKNGKHKKDCWEGQANAMTAGHAESWYDAVVASFGIVVKDGSREPVVADVIV